MNYAELYRQAMELSDPLAMARRTAERLGNQSEQLRQDALESGAMPRDFRVVIRFNRKNRFNTALNAELA